MAMTAVTDDTTIPPVREVDWSREAGGSWGNKGPKLLHAIRRYQHYAARKGLWAALMKRRWVASYHFWSVVTHSDIPLTASLGGGLILPHPNGIVLHQLSKVGNNCIIFHQVTLGTNFTHGSPVLGDHVQVGPGAKLLGEITIGDHAIIAANAVVTRDVPPATVVAGIPAKVVRRINYDPETGHKS